MPIVTCPSCGDADQLVGRRSPDGVTVTCGACGNRWQRDLSPTCTLCGSRDLTAVPTSTLEEAGRGDQRTPSGIREVFRCYGCGARDATSSSPVPDPEWERRPSTAAKAPRVRDDLEATPPSASASGGSRQVDSAFGRFASGEVIGDRWRLTRLLRWSSTGSLWLAQAVDADQRVVFKLVHPRLTSDPRRAALHAGSAQQVTRIRHPHLVPVLDVKVRDGHVLIVMAAIGGSVLRATSRLEPSALATTGAVLAAALGALHGHQVAHLDVRPEKILVDASGQARLIDTGSGRARASVRARVADSDRVAFQAPEQILSRDDGPAADVYSLGLTLWALAGGDLQQMGVNATAQASYRLTNHVPVLDPDQHGIPEHVAQAIAAATRRPVDQRPSAVELAGLLQG